MLRLLRTTSFRFTIIYVFIFAGAVAALGAYLYQATFGAAAQQTDTAIDAEITLLAEIFAAQQTAASGGGALRRAMRERSAARGGGLYLLIRAPSGAVLAGNLSALPPEALSADEGFFNFTYDRPLSDVGGVDPTLPIAGAADGAAATGDSIGPFSAVAASPTDEREGRGKILRFQASADAESFFLVLVARDISDRQQLRERLRGVIAQAALATVLLGILIGLLFARTLLRRVDAVNRTARAVRRGDLTKRVAAFGGGDELDSLAVNLNAMLDQIERLMSGMREVSDNIAHDLRSPLTRIRNRLTDAIEADGEEKDRLLKATLADAERMIGTFNALLSIARIESGEGAGVMEPVDVVAIAEELAELYEPAAEEAGFEVALVSHPAPPVKGSRALISQAVANMLDNALKYAEGGSHIVISVGRNAAGAVVLSVADDGPGIPKQDRRAVLRRFVRLETSRTTPGSGLGLSLVSAIARAHGAKLSLEDAQPSGDLDDGALRGLKLSL
ncbi:MAG: HAMP domain-containing sensor histidine kinase, partial [Pseudomonadota bacterium]